MTERRPVVRRWPVLAAALVAMAITARLGWWQLDRAATKTALAESVARRETLPPLDQRALLEALSDPQAVVHRPAQLRGRWVAQATVFLDNRPHQGRTGFIVLTPLLLEGRSEALLVQRGWVPRDFQNRTRLPAIDTPTTPVTVAGRLAPPPSQLYAFSAQESGPIRQNIEFSAFGQETGLKLLPLSLLQTDPGDAPLSRDWDRPGVDVHKHYGYAFQWFALCALIGLLYVWFQHIAPRRRRAQPRA